MDTNDTAQTIYRLLTRSFLASDLTVEPLACALWPKLERIVAFFQPKIYLKNQYLNPVFRLRIRNLTPSLILPNLLFVSN